MAVLNFFGLVGFSKGWFNAIFGLPSTRAPVICLDLSKKEFFIAAASFLFLFFSTFFFFFYFIAFELKLKFYLLNCFFLKVNLFNFFQSGFYLDFIIKKFAEMFARNVFVYLGIFFCEKFVIEFFTKKVFDNFLILSKFRFSSVFFFWIFFFSSNFYFILFYFFFIVFLFVYLKFCVY